MHANRQRFASPYTFVENLQGKCEKYLDLNCVEMQNMFPLAGVRPTYSNLMWKSGIKANICAEVKAASFIHASGQIETQLMWKLIAADWHFWVAGRRRRIWQPIRSGNPRREACRNTHHPSIQTAGRDSFQQRECSRLFSTVSETERVWLWDKKTGREAALEGGRRRSSRSQLELLMFDWLWNICEPLC